MSAAHVSNMAHTNQIPLTMIYTIKCFILQQIKHIIYIIHLSSSFIIFHCLDSPHIVFFHIHILILFNRPVISCN